MVISLYNFENFQFFKYSNIIEGVVNIVIFQQKTIDHFCKTMNNSALL